MIAVARTTLVPVVISAGRKITRYAEWRGEKNVREKRRESDEEGRKSVVLLTLVYADRHCLARAFCFLFFVPLTEGDTINKTHPLHHRR